MTTQAQLGDNTYTLERFPLDQKNRSLQAWDSGDEYLVNYVQEHYPDANSILILNDSFGALACAFNTLTVYSVNDSYISHQATRYNLQANELSTDSLTQLDSLAALPSQVDLVILKVPRNLGYLQHQLAAISAALPADIDVIAAGKTKDIHNSTIKAFSQYIGETSTSLAVKKSRLIISKTSGLNKVAPFPVN